MTKPVKYLKKLVVALTTGALRQEDDHGRTLLLYRSIIHSIILKFLVKFTSSIFFRSVGHRVESHLNLKIGEY
jgi:hypothetical protein